jgi:hypothetical protein
LEFLAPLAIASDDKVVVVVVVVGLGALRGGLGGHAVDCVCVSVCVSFYNNGWQIQAPQVVFELF